MGELYIHDLTPFIEKGCTNFVETGTGKGTGLKYACLYPFKKVYSVEIVQELVDSLQREFEFEERVTILCNSSVVGLFSILHDMNEEPTLFWLDAHFPGADFKFNDYHHMSDQKKLHMPLLYEIEAITSKRDVSNDFFIIDDLRIYERGDYELGNWDLYDTYGGGGIGFIEEAFGKTHDIERDYRHQGFIILTPKEN